MSAKHRKVNFNQPGLAVFDMDSTLIGIECIDEIAELVGRKAEVSAITEAAMRGELDFAASLKQRVAALAGIEERQFNQLFDPIPFTPGAAQLCAWLRARNWRLVIASGGFTWFAQQVADVLKIDHIVANQLEWQGGRLTGNVIEPIVDASAKAQTLTKFCREYGIAPNNTIAVGDGANDLEMMAAAHLSVAFCAKPKVQEAATICLNEPDLSLLIEQFERMECHG